MKKIAVLMAVIATLAGNAAYAQQTTTSRGSAAATSRRANESLAWGIGLGALAVLGVVVGLTGAHAENQKSTSPFAH